MKVVLVIHPLKASSAFTVYIGTKTIIMYVLYTLCQQVSTLGYIVSANDIIMRIYTHDEIEKAKKWQLQTENAMSDSYTYFACMDA